MSFPAHAASVVNCSPVTCIPSPESPANRITARVSVRRGFCATPAGAALSLMDSDPFLSFGEFSSLALEQRGRSPIPSACVHLIGAFQHVPRTQVQDGFREEIRHPLD